VTVSYTLNSGAQAETLSTLDWAGTAAISLTGNELGNYVIGNAGANVLDGKGGFDALQGLGGADTFAFTTALGSANVDHIADMVSGTDRIALDHGVFAGLGLGALNANAFVIGTAAGDADDRIVYNSATGELFFDADGNGAGAAVLFAVLDGHPLLAASDFTVI
jgi:Ca2+-binding RTX toxin-like protein